MRGYYIHDGSQTIVFFIKESLGLHISTNGKPNPDRDRYESYWSPKKWWTYIDVLFQYDMGA